MTSFKNVAEIDSALRCVREAREMIVNHYGLTSENEWITIPPLAIGEALQRIHAAQEHLENLCEYGSSSWALSITQ